jgi:hypothetical protein
MIKLYGIDLTTAQSFLIFPVQGEMPGEGVRLKPQLMLSDDLAASFADPDADWTPAVDSDGQPLVDTLNATVRLTFDYASLTGEYSEGADGRAVAAGDTYKLDVTGLCSAQNYTYATSGFLDKTRLQEWIEANQSFIGNWEDSEQKSDTL